MGKYICRQRYPVWRKRHGDHGQALKFFEIKKQNLPLHYVPESSRDISIGRNCFIGAGSIILGKVKIANYSVVAGCAG